MPSLFFLSRTAFASAARVLFTAKAAQLNNSFAMSSFCDSSVTSSAIEPKVETMASCMRYMAGLAAASGPRVLSRPHSACDLPTIMGMTSAASPASVSPSASIICTITSVSGSVCNCKPKYATACFVLPRILAAPRLSSGVPVLR